MGLAGCAEGIDGDDVAFVDRLVSTLRPRSCETALNLGCSVLSGRAVELATSLCWVVIVVGEEEEGDA